MNRVNSRPILACMLTIAASAGIAHEPPSGLLIHMPFDGSAEVRGRAMAAEVVSTDPDNPVGSLTYVNGYQGQAATFDGENAVRIPFDLNPDVYPQLTVTMWINAQKDQQTGYLFSNGSPAGPKLQYSMANLIAHAPGALARVPNMVRIDRWVFVAGVWDHDANTLRMYADRRFEEVELEAAAARRDPRAKPESWIGTYNANLQSTVKGVLIDEVKIYGRALSADELLGLALGPPIEEKPRQTGPFVIPTNEDKPQLIEPPLPPEEESEPHEAPFDATDSDPDPRDEMHRDRSASDDSGTRPGEDPMLDKLRRTQAPGGHQSDDAVRDVLEDEYEPGPTTDWEEVQEEARKPKVDEEQLDRLRQSAGSDISPGTDRIDDTVRDQLDENEVPEPTDFETRRQGLEPDEESQSEEKKPVVSGSLELTPSKDGEVYFELYDAYVYAYPSVINSDERDSLQKVDLSLGGPAVHTIEWYEKRDRPCKVVIYGYAPGTNALGGPNVSSFGRDFCKGGANDRSRKSVSLQSYNGVITELVLGTTSPERGQRMKGIKISGAPGTRTGPTNEVIGDSSTHANFEEWHRPSYCPSAYYAAWGIRLYLRLADDGSSEIVDMALICGSF